MARRSDDPTVVRSIAVTASDVVAAYEANRESGPRTVLRVTPPFSGMMRARLHRVEDAPGEGPVHVEPADLLADDLDPYPHPDDTEDELRADPSVEYTPERHHDHHVGAVRRWRERAQANLADSVEIETPDGPHEVEVTVLGSQR